MYRRIFITFMFLMPIVLIYVIHQYTVTPDHMIIGEWVEDSWDYEKVNRRDELLLDLRLSNMIKHEAENWVFEPNKTVIFKKNGKQVGIGSWVIKGRGHILRIAHEDGQEELFDIKQLTGKDLTLNFDIGMEIRGVAKLHFTRKEEVEPQTTLPEKP